MIERGVIMNRTITGPLLTIVTGLLLWTSVMSCEGKKCDWAPLEFLLGNWAGEGTGQPGQGTGEFSFHPDLQNRILVRRSYAAYPPTKERPAYRHDDLMMVYRESESAPPRAIYFDNEGHVIHYSMSAPSDMNTIEFVSDILPTNPRYRLTYSKTGSGTLIFRFEIAPPDRPDAFSTYIEAKAKRK